jgi:hypothetical protein
MPSPTWTYQPTDTDRSESPLTAYTARQRPRRQSRRRRGAAAGQSLVYDNPNQLDAPIALKWGMTPEQLLTAALPLAVCAIVWPLSLVALPGPLFVPTFPFLGLRLLVPLLVSVVVPGPALVLAKWRPFERALTLTFLVWLTYQQTPKRAVWRPRRQPHAPTPAPAAP